jgi:mRNA interferase MazF
VKRGALVVVAVQGGYGKPRPALVIQSDLFNETHGSVTVVPLTTAIVDAPLFRITVEPSKQNGLHAISQIMVDKLTTVRRDRVGDEIGRLDERSMTQVGRALALWLGIAA